MVNQGNVYGYIYMDIFSHIYIYKDIYIYIHICEIFGSTKEHMEVFLSWK